MKAVLATGTHFNPIELYGVVCVQVEIEALEKERDVHAIGGCYAAADRLVDPVLKAEDARGTAYILYGAGGAVNSVRIGGILKIEGEDRGACSGQPHLFRCAAVCHRIGISDTGQGIQGALELCTDFGDRVLAGCQGDRIDFCPFGEAEHVPANIHIIEIRGHTAIHKFYGDHVFQGATECPAKGIGFIIGHEIAVTAIDGHSNSPLLSVFSR